MKSTLSLSLAALAATASLSTAIAQTPSTGAQTEPMRTPSTNMPKEATPPGTDTKAIEGDTRKPKSTKDKNSKEQMETTGKPTAKVPGTATPPGAGGRGIEGDTSRTANPNAKDQPSTMGTDTSGGAPSGGTAGAGTSTPRTPDNPATKTVPSGGSK